MKKILTLSAAFLCSISALAQSSYVMVVKDGVNLRKTPSTSAPKLMMELQDDCFEDCKVNYVWDNSPRKRNMSRVAFHPFIESIAEVVGESGGWTRIAADDWADMKPWISSQFVRPVQQAVFSDAQYIRMMNNDESMRGKIRTHGKYAGMLLESMDEAEDYWFVEKFSDGKLYSSRQIHLYVAYESDMRGLRFSEEDGVPLLIYGSDLRMDGAPEVEQGAFDLDKFTDSQLDQLFSTLLPGSKFEYEVRFFDVHPSFDEFSLRYVPMRTAIK